MGPVHSAAWGGRTQKGSEKHGEVSSPLWRYERSRDVFYPQATPMEILAQSCHMNSLCFPVLPAFRSGCETWKSSLWMRMGHWVGRVSSWGFISRSPIKCKVGRVPMRGKKWPPEGSAVSFSRLSAAGGNGHFICLLGSGCVQGEIVFMLSLRAGKAAQCQIWTHCLGDEINLNFGGGYQISLTSEPRNSFFPKELWVEKFTAGISSSCKHDTSLLLLYRGVVKG